MAWSAGAGVTAHLVFFPRSAGGPRWFLWGLEPNTSGAEPLRPLAALGTPATARVVSERLRSEAVSGLDIQIGDGLATLGALDAHDLAGVPASVAAWSLAAKLALELIARERVVPRLYRDGDEVRVGWGLSLSASGDDDRFRRLARALPTAAHAVPLPDRRIPTAAAVLADFLDAAADALLTRAAPRSPLPKKSPPRWESRFVAALTHNDGAGASVEPEVRDEIEAWLEPDGVNSDTERPRLCLKLDTPEVATASRWPLSYFLQAPDDPSLLLPAARAWSTAARHLEWMDRGFAAPQETLLQRLGEAARLFPPIEISDRVREVRLLG